MLEGVEVAMGKIFWFYLFIECRNGCLGLSARAWDVCFYSVILIDDHRNLFELFITKKRLNVKVEFWTYHGDM